MLEFLKETFPRDSSITERGVYNYIMVACSPNGGSASTSEHEPHLPGGKGGCNSKPPSHATLAKPPDARGREKHWKNRSAIPKAASNQNMKRDSAQNSYTTKSSLSFLLFGVSGGRWAVLGLGTQGSSMRCRDTGTGVKKNERNGQKSQKYAFGEEAYRLWEEMTQRNLSIRVISGKKKAS